MRLGLFFFFSSRRRHTRLQGDWSSDVCSSDLGFAEQAFASPLEPAALERTFATAVGAAAPARRAQVASWAAAHWDWERCTDAYLALLREVTVGGAAH